MTAATCEKEADTPTRPAAAGSQATPARAGPAQPNKPKPAGTSSTERPGRDRSLPDLYEALLAHYFHYL